ncbi:hypothetical protein GQ44DRAFT_281642 [Phaeosphaeriaceae sp. PMI808]|nr:hypothetical protein GQ44DRAFT_281642 [Phaeosphaeriaceae sp. PMI808]
MTNNHPDIPNTQCLPSITPQDSSRVACTSTHSLTAQQLSLTKAASATRTFFDPWNSSSTGHQRAENTLSGSTTWRASRNLKLNEQYRGGPGGGAKRVADTVGAGSENFGQDGRKANGGRERGAKGLRTGGQKSLTEVWGVRKGSNKPSQSDDTVWAKLPPREDVVHLHTTEGHFQSKKAIDLVPRDDLSPLLKQTQIFAGLCFYINCSTAPFFSDHKLRQLLATHGAKHTIALSRRSVTHVLLGTTNAQGGAGGSLAASKIQKEISKAGGKAMKFVTTEWVLESIKANRRLPESRFPPLKLTPKNQGSVFDMMRADSVMTKKRNPS